MSYVQSALSKSVNGENKQEMDVSCKEKTNSCLLVCWKAQTWNITVFFMRQMGKITLQSLRQQSGWILCSEPAFEYF